MKNTPTILILFIILLTACQPTPIVVTESVNTPTEGSANNPTLPTPDLTNTATAIPPKPTPSPSVRTSATTANISKAYLTNNEDGSGEVTVFAQDEIIYAIVVLKSAPDDTVVKTEWIAVNVENTEPNYLIDTVELTTGSDTLTFNLSNTGLWPLGEYRANVYLNEELTKSLTFTVR